LAKLFFHFGSLGAQPLGIVSAKMAGCPFTFPPIQSGRSKLLKQNIFSESKSQLYCCLIYATRTLPFRYCRHLRCRRLLKQRAMFSLIIIQFARLIGSGLSRPDHRGLLDANCPVTFDPHGSVQLLSRARPSKFHRLVFTSRFLIYLCAETLKKGVAD
jgi:hypothetical protein